GGALQPLGMLGALIDRAAISALAFEHAARIVQPVGQDADLGLRRRNELAVEPDQVGTLVEGHRHGISSKEHQQRAVGVTAVLLRRLAAFASRPISRYVVGRTSERASRAVSMSTIETRTAGTILSSRRGFG